MDFISGFLVEVEIISRYTFNPFSMNSGSTVSF